MAEDHDDLLAFLIAQAARGLSLSIYAAIRLMHARIRADEPRPSGSRQFGRTSDVVFFPPRGG